MKFLKDFGAWVALALALLAGAVGYGSLTTDVATTKVRVDRVEPQVQQHGQDIAGIKPTLDAMQRSLDRLEDKFGTKK